MQVRCLALQADGSVRQETEAAALNGWRAGAGPYWIDLHGDDFETITTWLADLGVDPARLAMLHFGDGESKVLPLVEFVYFAIPVLGEGTAGALGSFGCLCLERLVITMHDQAVSSPMLDVDQLVGRKLQDASSAGVLCALATIHGMRLRSVVAKLRKEGDVLARRMDAGPRTVGLREILALKNRVLELSGMVDEDLAVLQVLKAISHPALGMPRVDVPYQFALDVVHAADRDLDRTDRRALDLQERYEAAQQDETNRRLGMLTMLSAAFMPLTLIAGIYGMNFKHMPGLEYPWAYPIVLGVMALTALGFLWFFRTRWGRRDGQG
jgi:magnesium transporter